MLTRGKLAGEPDGELERQLSFVTTFAFEARAR